MLTVQISPSRLRQLLKDQALLDQLHANGVNNWSGWGENEAGGESASEYADRLDDTPDEELYKQI